MSRFYKTSVPQYEDYSAYFPEEMMMSAMGTMDKKIETGKQTAEQLRLGLVNIPYLKKDKPFAEAIIGQYNDEITELSKRINEDPLNYIKHNAEVLELTNKLQHDLNFGDLKSIVGEYNWLQEKQKELEEYSQLHPGDTYAAQIKRNLEDYYERTYTSYKDTPRAGTSGITPLHYDVFDKWDNYVRNIAPKEFENIQDWAGTLEKLKITRSGTSRDEKIMLEAMYNFIQDPTFVGFAYQYTNFPGTKEEAMKMMPIQAITDSVGNIIKYEYNPDSPFASVLEAVVKGARVSTSKVTNRPKSYSAPGKFVDPSGKEVKVNLVQGSATSLTPAGQDILDNLQANFNAAAQSIYKYTVFPINPKTNKPDTTKPIQYEELIVEDVNPFRTNNQGIITGEIVYRDKYGKNDEIEIGGNRYIVGAVQVVPRENEFEQDIARMERSIFQTHQYIKDQQAGFDLRNQKQKKSYGGYVRKNMGYGGFVRKKYQSGTGNEGVPVVPDPNNPTANTTSQSSVIPKGTTSTLVKKGSAQQIQQTVSGNISEGGHFLTPIPTTTDYHPTGNISTKNTFNEFQKAYYNYQRDSIGLENSVSELKKVYDENPQNTTVFSQLMLQQEKLDKLKKDNEIYSYNRKENESYLTENIVKEMLDSPRYNKKYKEEDLNTAVNLWKVLNLEAQEEDPVYKQKLRQEKINFFETPEGSSAYGLPFKEYVDILTKENLTNEEIDFFLNLPQLFEVLKNKPFLKDAVEDFMNPYTFDEEGEAIYNPMFIKEIKGMIDGYYNSEVLKHIPYGGDADYSEQQIPISVPKILGVSLPGTDNLNIRKVKSIIDKVYEKTFKNIDRDFNEVNTAVQNRDEFQSKVEKEIQYFDVKNYIKNTPKDINFNEGVNAMYEYFKSNPGSFNMFSIIEKDGEDVGKPIELQFFGDKRYPVELQTLVKFAKDKKVPLEEIMTMKGFTFDPFEGMSFHMEVDYNNLLDKLDLDGFKPIDWKDIVFSRTFPYYLLTGLMGQENWANLSETQLGSILPKALDAARHQNFPQEFVLRPKKQNDTYIDSFTKDMAGIVGKRVDYKIEKIMEVGADGWEDRITSELLKPYVDIFILENSNSLVKYGQFWKEAENMNLQNSNVNISRIFTETISGLPGKEGSVDFTYKIEGCPTIGYFAYLKGKNNVWTILKDAEKNKPYSFANPYTAGVAVLMNLKKMENALKGTESDKVKKQKTKLEKQYLDNAGSGSIMPGGLAGFDVKK